MDSLTREWERFSLTGKEGVKIILNSSLAQPEFILVARFLTRRPINIEAITRTFRPLWRAEKGFVIKDLGENKASITFQDDVDLERVITNGPWSYDKFLVVLQRVEDDTPLASMSLNMAAFWVQIHGLPLRCMKRQIGQQIGGTLGEVVPTTLEDEGTSAGNFVRIRILINISEPLCRGRLVGLGGGRDTLISFKYEKLPNFCYWCGCLTHADKDCPVWLRSKGSLQIETQQYGSWLRASSLRRPRSNTRESQGNKSNGHSTPQEQRSVSPENIGVSHPPGVSSGQAQTVEGTQKENLTIPSPSVEIPASPLHEDYGPRDLRNMQAGFTYVENSRHPDMEGSNQALNILVNIESVARALKDLTNLTDGPSPIRPKPWKRQARQAFDQNQAPSIQLPAKRPGKENLDSHQSQKSQKFMTKENKSEELTPKAAAGLQPRREQ